MKAKYALVIFLVAVLALTGVGCMATGGGWFINDLPPGSPWPELDGHKITFGYNAQITVDEAVKGKLQLIDQDSKTRIHGSFNGTAPGGFSGTCSINGTGDYPFELFCMDAGEPGPTAGDWIEIGIDGSWPSYIYKYQGYLQGGNIKGHTKQ